MKIITRTIEEHADYGKYLYGLYIDRDGNEFLGIPGVIAHDYPNTEIVVEVDGPEATYAIFDTLDEFETWKNQI